jgi:RimJ/RimL family protein N-acetyltransferase
VPDELRLRPATSADAELLLAWRNDPATRAASRTRGTVAPAAHRRWLAGKLADPAVRLAIAEVDGVAVGQLRAELTGSPAEAEVHLGLAPEARGRGLGSRLVEAGVRLAAAELGVRRVIAHVRPDNVASVRSFERAGFAADGRDGDLLRLVRPS